MRAPRNSLVGCFAWFALGARWSSTRTIPLLSPPLTVPPSLPRVCVLGRSASNHTLQCVLLIPDVEGARALRRERQRAASRKANQAGKGKNKGAAPEPAEEDSSSSEEEEEDSSSEEEESD